MVLPLPGPYDVLADGEEGRDQGDGGGPRAMHHDEHRELDLRQAGTREGKGREEGEAHEGNRGEVRTQWIRVRRWGNSRGRMTGSLSQHACRLSTRRPEPRSRT